MSVRSTLTRALAAASLVAVSCFAAAPAMAFSFGAEAEAETEVAPTAYDCDEKEESKFCRPAEPVEENSFAMAPPSRFVPYDDVKRPAPPEHGKRPGPPADRPGPPVCDIYGSKYGFIYGERCIMLTEPHINPPPPVLMGVHG